MINIVLAEDHHIVRNGIRYVLEQQDNSLLVTGEATNGAEVLELLAKGINADILLMDMNMPVMGGMDLMAQVARQYPALKVIVLSALEHEKYVLNAFEAGVSGYLLKSVRADELTFAIKHVYHNNRYVCSELTSYLINRLLAIPEPVAIEQVLNVDLSDREIEILGLIAEGYTNQEIADKVFTSKRTIEGHRLNLIEKTGSRNTASLIKFALNNGIIS